MAAPSAKFRGMLLHPAFRHVVASNCGHFLQNQVALPALTSQLILVRHKAQKRFKAPPVAQDQKWTMKTSSVKKQRVMPKNWAEKVLSRVPVDDVWIRSFYGRPRYSFQAAIDMHRELLSPEMMNHPDALLHLHCKLDFRTKKKTKFMSHVTKTVVLPHQFDDGTKNRVLAICKPGEKTLALEAGAEFAGGIDIIKALEKGEISQDEYDHVVCTVDMLTEVVTIRKVLRDLLPNKNKGTLGGDIAGLVSHFVQGRTYESVKEEDAVGLLKVAIGRLNMPLSELQENYDTYVEAICSQRNPDLGPFIQEALLQCPPSVEQFQLTAVETLPPTQRKEAARLLEQQLEQEEEEEVAPESDDEEEAVRAKAK